MRLLLTFLLLPFLYSCSKEDDLQKYSFQNTTEFNVVVSPDEISGPYFELPIPAGSFQIYKSKEMYSLFDVKSNETDKNFACRYMGNNLMSIYSFNNMVLYKITGQNTSSANITYNNSDGSTGQRTVTLPHNIGYDYFSEKFQYISAQNNSNTGLIKVEIYFEDSLVSSDECSGAYCIATASSNK